MEWRQIQKRWAIYIIWFRLSFKFWQCYFWLRFGNCIIPLALLWAHTLTHTELHLILRTCETKIKFWFTCLLCQLNFVCGIMWHGMNRHMSLEKRCPIIQEDKWLLKSYEMATAEWKKEHELSKENHINHIGVKERNRRPSVPLTLMCSTGFSLAKSCSFFSPGQQTNWSICTKSLQSAIS